MHSFFITDLTPQTITLSEEESKHCVRVMRKRAGDEIELIDGKGTWAAAIIADANPKKCSLHIETRTSQPREKKIAFHLAVAPTKNFERMDWLIEKCVEIGINELSFVSCEHSERTKINMERCHKIAVSALKQSRQYWLPQINDLKKLADFANGTETNETKYVAWCEEKNQTLLACLAKAEKDKSIQLLIGPEGDFTATEIELLKRLGYKSVSLGKTILRTETAAMYAAVLVNAMTE